jgi:hypothetical protein
MEAMFALERQADMQQPSMSAFPKSSRLIYPKSPKRDGR